MTRSTTLSRMTGYVWASPCSLVGLLLAFPAVLLGARPRRVRGVIEVAAASPQARLPALLRALPFRAITFGHVVIGTCTTELDRLRDHEHQHVRQYELWGPFFFVAYPLSSLVQWARGNHPYLHNRFEVQARAKCVALDAARAAQARSSLPR